jgi:peptide deformylase
MKFLKHLFFIYLITSLTSCVGTKNFTSNQKKMIKGDLVTKPMRVYLITNKQDSLLLRTKSTYIKPNPRNKVLQQFSKRLITTVTDPKSLGVGIAAPQVGILKNIICVQRLDKENVPFEIYINPVITKYSTKKRKCPEGCLSIPNKRATTLDRAYTIILEYDKLDGKHYTETVDDFVSVIFQHEIDHLNGILFIDHLLEETKKNK